MTDTFIIHTAGKTGSQTIEQTLRASRPGAIVERHHFFSEQTISELRATCALPDAVPSVANSILSQCRCAERCRDMINADHDNALFVVSAYRDPFKQAVAAVFQNLSVFIPNFDTSVPAIHWLDQLIDQFSYVFRERNALAQSASFLDRRRSRPVTGFAHWLETDFNLAHNVDVYEHELDDIGTVYFKDGQRSFLIYKMEQLDHNFDRILSTIIEDTPINRVDTNRAQNKQYNELYRLFLKNFMINDEMNEHYYNNRFYKHFYN